MSAITKCGIALAASAFFVLPLQLYAFTYHPTVADVFVEPGETVEQLFSLYNDQDTIARFELELVEVDLSNSDEVSVSDLTSDDASWLRINTELVNLQPFEQTDVVLSAAPPASVDAQLRTFGVQIREITDEDTGVAIRPGALVLLFIAVDSENIEADYASRLSASPRLALGLPISFSLTIQNNGPRLVQPSGNLKIMSLLGREVESVEMNPGGYRVLAGEQRMYQVAWGEDDEYGTDLFGSLLRELSHFTIGVFHVQPELQAWPGGPDLDVSSMWVFVLPPYSMFVLIVLLGLLWIIARHLKRRS